MTIRPQWKQTFSLFNDYIVSNPEIYIDSHEIAIPEHLRDVFYEHFDKVRRSVVESWQNSYDLDVDTLGKSYTGFESELIRLLNLKQIHLPVNIESFLHDPKEGMIRSLYDRMFHLIQGKISQDDFESLAEMDLAESTVEMFRLGYEPWAALALILLLEPDEAFRVELDDDGNTLTVPLDEVAFGRQFSHPAKRIPEFIIHSKKLNSYIAFKMPLAREVDMYILPVEIPTKRLLRDRTGDTSAVLDFRIIFLSVVSDLNKIPVFADLHKRELKGPDLMVEFLMGHDISDEHAVFQVQKHIETIKPERGGNIVIMNPDENQIESEPKVNIDTYAVGLDQSKLQPILDKLN